MVLRMKLNNSIGTMLLQRQPSSTVVSCLLFFVLSRSSVYLDRRLSLVAWSFFLSLDGQRKPNTKQNSAVDVDGLSLYVWNGSAVRRAPAARDRRVIF